MRQLPPLSLLIPVAACGLGLVALEGWLLRRARSDATQALAALKQMEQERDWLAHQVPALSAENETTLAAELAAAGKAHDELKQALTGPAPAMPAEPPPAGTTEAYFELTDFIGQLRARAAQASVGLKRDEYFGFASYQNEGPVDGEIVVVHRQRLVIQYLVELLLESRPQALLALRRERPAENRGQGQRDRPEDFFELDPSGTMRRQGQGAAEAYQLEFTGQTAALRNFLNRLATGRWPVVVRSVQVEWLASTSDRIPLSASVSTVATLPLVGPNLAKFNVAVEIIRLAGDPGRAAP